MRSLHNEFSNLLEELDRVRELATKARASEGDPATKWTANGELVSWLRTNCFTILSALEAGAEYSGRISGVSRQRLYNSLRLMQDEVNHYRELEKA